jgi:hypothetical protein
MQTGRNRYGRKDHSGRLRANRGRGARRLRWAALGATLLSLALPSISAQAITGGAGVPGAEGTLTGTGGLVFSSPMRTAGATWYGPGLYGNSTACGRTLRPSTVGVAHKTLPCGTAVRFVYEGRSLITRVIDRGPYSPGNAFDLTNGARRALGFEGVDQVRYAVAVGTRRNRD